MKNKVVISPVDMKERANLGMRAGDTVRVWLKIEEKGKTRLQAFEGLVLARKHGNEAGGTFTVHKVSGGVGVDKILPLYSPTIDKIEIIKRSKVRRSKLYLLRGKVAREVKRILRRSTIVAISTKGSAELEEERKVAEAQESARLEEETKRAEAEEVAAEMSKEAGVEVDKKEDESSSVEAIEDKEEKESEKEELPPIEITESDEGENNTKELEESEDEKKEEVVEEGGENIEEAQKGEEVQK